MLRSSRALVAILVGAHVVALAGGWLAGVVLSRDMPGVENLDVMDLPRRTVLLDGNEELLHAFAEQQRIPVRLREVSPWYVKAIVATEDPRFEGHIGVDPIAVARAALATVRAMDFGVEGASTITMQLARLQFLHPKKTVSRKLQEMLLATQIERNYSKEEILSLYCNRIYLGHGTYGVEAASRHYFGKPAAELDLPQSALLAGLTQMPERLTPFRHPQRALQRRNYVLRRMVAEGLIDPQLADEAAGAPLDLAIATAERSVGPYFIEQVRRFTAKEFGESALYREGLVVRTTLDPNMQRFAEVAVAKGLDAYGKRHAQTAPPRPLPEDATPADYEDGAWVVPFLPGEVVDAIVVGVGDDSAEVRILERTFTILFDDLDWTREKKRGALFETDHLVRVAVEKVDELGLPGEVTLASAPTPQAALIAMDAVTGEVRALVGGSDFESSEFNRALQAKRQAGSAFKPFIFAAALEQGFLPIDRIRDVPTVIVDPGAEEPYQPENFERNYEGSVTLRHALEHSRNIPTVRLLDAIGYTPAVDIARRLGIASELKPFPSLALGSFEVDLGSLVAAYAAFVNGGVLVEPTLVLDVGHSDGTTAWSASNEAVEVLDPEVAAMVSSMLEGVVLRGTGRRAKVLGHPVGGKTGTTDEFTDAWFVGFTADMAVGVWVGHDRNETLGRSETGARAALPIWIDFLDGALAGREPVEIGTPPGIRRSLIDAETGRALQREAGCEKAILESFPVGREFPRRCDRRMHFRATLPYPLQAYPLTERYELVITPAEAAALVAGAGAEKVRIESGGRRLVYRWNELTSFIKLAWDPADWDEYISRLPLELEQARQRIEELDEFWEAWEEEQEALAEERAARGEESPEDEEEPVVPAHLRRGVDGWPTEIVEVHRGKDVRWPRLPIDP